MAPNKPFSSLKHCVIKPLPKHQCPGCSRKVFTTAGLTKHIQYHHPGLLDDQDNIRSDPHIPNDEDSPPSSSPDVALLASPPVASPMLDVGMSASHPVGSLSQAHNNAPSPASLHPSSPAPPSLFHHERPHSPPSFLPHMDIDDVIDFFPRSTSPPNQSPSGHSDSPESPIPSHRGDSLHGNAQSPTAEDTPILEHIITSLTVCICFLCLQTYLTSNHRSHLRYTWQQYPTQQPSSSSRPQVWPQRLVPLWKSNTIQACQLSLPS